MKSNLTYHLSQETLHVNCEKPHAYFIPYHSDSAAATYNRSLSSRFVSLCGEWSFRYYESVNVLPNFLAPDYTDEVIRNICASAVRNVVNIAIASLR